MPDAGPFIRVPSPPGYSGRLRVVDGTPTDDPTVCPGYLTSLPEVIEVARGRLHWSKAGPAAIGVADWQHDPLAIGIEILEGAVNECQAWCFDNPEKK